jgi:hypothetical protein
MCVLPGPFVDSHPPLRVRGRHRIRSSRRSVRGRARQEGRKVRQGWRESERESVWKSVARGRRPGRGGGRWRRGRWCCGRKRRRRGRRGPCRRGCRRRDGGSNFNFNSNRLRREAVNGRCGSVFWVPDHVLGTHGVRDVGGGPRPKHRSLGSATFVARSAVTTASLSFCVCEGCVCGC